jgi:hypothetical protein
MCLGPTDRPTIPRAGLGSTNSDPLGKPPPTTIVKQSNDAADLVVSIPGSKTGMGQLLPGGLSKPASPTTTLDGKAAPGVDQLLPSGTDGLFGPLIPPPPEASGTFALRDLQRTGIQDLKINRPDAILIPKPKGRQNVE